MKNYVSLQPQKDKVPWMSGLVSGLQNHVRRFESARYLQIYPHNSLKFSIGYEDFLCRGLKMEILGDDLISAYTEHLI